MNLFKMISQVCQSLMDIPTDSFFNFFEFLAQTLLVLRIQNFIGHRE